MKIPPIVRHPDADAPVPGRRWTWLLLVLPILLQGAESVHLLGFVERLCVGEPYCFELRVKPAYVGQVGEHIVVRFASVEKIYDPENYELTLTQQQIVPGSHLRLLMSADAGRGPGAYRASVIWIGD